MCGMILQGDRQRPTEGKGVDIPFRLLTEQPLAAIYRGLTSNRREEVCRIQEPFRGRPTFCLTDQENTTR